MATPPFIAASLYVGDLKPEVIEQHLFDHFSTAGIVKSVLVCRDRHTKRSLGYGYVNFQSQEDAERALETLNYTPILGQPCRIAWSHRDNQQRLSGVGNLFVSNLDLDIDEKKLQDTFSAMGPIASVRIARKNAQSLGHGFVQFERIEDAQRAIAELNGKPFGSKNIEVQPFVPRAKREEPVHFTNVYVKGFDKSWDEERLKSVFERFGTITSTCLARDPATKQSRGFGFLNFSNSEQAQQAVNEMNNAEVDGHKLYVGKAMGRAARLELLRRQFEERDRCNTYVKYLDLSVDEEALKKHFGGCGTITSVLVRRDDVTHQSRGFGFVCFSAPEEAARAVQQLNGTTLAGRPIFVAHFQRKVERERALAIQKQQQVMNFMSMGGYPVPPRGMPANFAAAMAPQMFGFPLVFPNQPSAAAAAAAQTVGAVPAPGTAQTAGAAAQRIARYPVMPGMAATPFPWWPFAQQQVAQATMMGGRRAVPRALSAQQRPPLPGGAPVVGAPAGKPVAAPGVPAAAAGRAVQYQATIRNPPKPVEAVPTPAPVTLAAPAESSFPAQDLLSSLRACTNPAEQKQQIGEYLFPLVQKDNPELAGKITGMLLEMDVSELIAIIETPAELQAKIKEAHEVLVAAQQQQAAGLPADAAPAQ